MSSLYSYLVSLIILCKICESASYNLKCVDKNFTFINRPGKVFGDFCDRNNCVAKCCHDGEILNRKKICVKTEKKYDYSRFTIFKNDIERKIQVSKMNLTRDFTFVYDQKFMNRNCSMRLSGNKTKANFYMLEDGSLVEEIPNYYNRWHGRRSKLEYCAEIYHNDRSNRTLYVYHLLDAITTNTNEMDGGSETVIVIGMLISAFFLLITFVMYWLLPELRNINGMIHMAYVGGLMITFILKAVLHFPRDERVCYHVVPIYYFFLISNFLWLATMSFNIWWTFRGTILQRKVHRRGEICKFFQYCLAVYGTVGVLTTFATVVDRTDLRHLPDFVKPRFEECFSALYEVILYVYVPIGVLIVINCTLFVMTLYNIWVVKKGMREFDAKETRGNQVAVCSFKVYVKLSFMMGVSWIIEVGQMWHTLPLWPHIAVNLINSLIGVIIFVLFMMEKKTLTMVLRRNANPGQQSKSSNITRQSNMSDSKTKQSTIEKKNESEDRLFRMTDENYK